MTRTLLLVDDESGIRAVARLALELAGWTVETASSGAEGVEAANRLHPDAILLDVMMPGMDGPTTLCALRAGTATACIPVLFMTAKSRPADLERLSALGAAGILAKPFDPMQLPTDIARLLSWTEA